jgi:hypothetical protein
MLCIWKDMKMARNKKMLIIGIAIILVIGSVVYFVWQFWDVALVIRTMSRNKQQGQVRLLCKTDHQALLDACRELSRRVARGDLKSGRYNVCHDPHPDVAGFPQPILDLGPSSVVIGDDGGVMLAMMGGLDHYGVYAYPDDYKKPTFVGSKLGDKELIPGLWYYDDGYEINSRYHKKIDALIQKGKMKKQDKQDQRND